MDASLILRCARPDGLILPVIAASKQIFHGEWEFVVVDSACEERRELLSHLWATLCPNVPLKHVRPLPPNGDSYTSWDIPLFQNTGWVWADGRVCVHIEDNEAFGVDFLRRHVAFIDEHPNMVSIGDIRQEPLFEEDAKGHYDRRRPKELREEMLSDSPDLTYQLANPSSLKCANAHHYGWWLSGNMGCRLEHILAFNGVPEVSTHWPENETAHAFFNYGLSMWPLDDVTVWHQKHPQNRIIGQVLSYDANLDCVYTPVKQIKVGDLQPAGDAFHRDIRVTRKVLRGL